MTYVPPAGMGALYPMMAQDWISAHPQLMEAQMQHLFDHIYHELDQVCNICQLMPRQKYAIL